MNARLAKPQGIRISACTIVKNEAKNIARCIESFKYFVDEIIVVDTGSQDGTAAIAEGLGARVLHFEWCSDFSAAKNCALDAATGDWVVFPDADEYFNEGCGTRVREAIDEAERGGFNALGSRMVNINVGSTAKLAEIFTIRVFKAGMRYVYPVHEEISCTEGIKLLTCDRSWFHFYHTGYSADIIGQKSDRNLSILLEALADEPNPARKAVYCAYISDCYFTRRDYKKSRDYAKKFISDRRKYGIELLGCDAKPYLNIINSLEAENAEVDELNHWVGRLETDFPDYPDAAYARGRLQLRRRLFSHAIAEFDRALELSAAYDKTDLNTVESESARINYLYGLCYEGLLNIPDAMNRHFKAIIEKVDFQEAMFALFRLCKDMPEEEVEKLVGSLFQGGSRERHVCVMAGLMSNYMSKQLVKCYSYYSVDRKLETIDINVSAFIMAGSGNFEGAAKMFTMQYGVDKNPDTAMRALLCAVFSNDAQAVEAALPLCEPALAQALGLAEGEGLGRGDLPAVAKLVGEAGRMRGTTASAELAGKIARSLYPGLATAFSRELEVQLDFAGALAALEFAVITPESVFLRGYYLYRLGRLVEASDLLIFAKHLGYSGAVLDSLLLGLTEIKLKNVTMAEQGRAENIKRRALEDIGDGRFSEALELIVKCKELMPDDVELYSMESVALYSSGLYHKAAVAVESGLIKFNDNFDLLYNGGEIYAKLGDTGKALAMYKKALGVCSGGLSEQITEAIRKLEAD